MWLIQWSKSLSKKNEFGVPIRNFARVVDTIYRGALPDTEGYRALTEKLGVYRVCSIIEHESREDRKRALDAGIKEWRYIPFSDKDAPPPNRVREWLDYIRTSKKKGPIFTHCRGGRHRTGVLVGVFRVTDCGWTKDQAFEEMNKYGWYAALGHQPLKDWFFGEFDPEDYRKEPPA
ncbi:MAG TPA: protein-tyrosine phosphatase family protein [Blastocatellia bacterium]|nr:protein-tyrosine phosphatase family protein [Blastocatellia bacterium]